MEEFEKLFDIEKRVALIEQNILSKKELDEQYKKLMKEAFDLQAGEYSRRLIELNHAHQTAEDNWTRSLPRETFDMWKMEYEKKQIEFGLMGTTYLSIATFESWKKENDLWRVTVAPNTGIYALERRIDELKAFGENINIRIVSIEKDMLLVPATSKRITDLYVLVNRFQGAIWILGVLGVMGVISLIMNFLRLTGAIK